MKITRRRRECSTKMKIRISRAVPAWRISYWPGASPPGFGPHPDIDGDREVDIRLRRHHMRPFQGKTGREPGCKFGIPNIFRKCGFSQRLDTECGILLPRTNTLFYGNSLTISRQFTQLTILACYLLSLFAIVTWSSKGSWPIVQKTIRYRKEKLL